MTVLNYHVFVPVDHLKIAKSNLCIKDTLSWPVTLVIDPTNQSFHQTIPRISILLGMEYLGQC